MGQYILRRLGISFITAFGVVFIIFAAVRFLPGNTVDTLLQSGGFADVKSREDLERALGIDKPLLIQFGKWVGGILQGDFGQSMVTRRSIGGDLVSAVPVTLQLGLMSVSFAVIFGVPLGVISAVKQNTLIDYVFRSGSIFFLSVPGFLLATLIITYASLWWNYSPPLTYVEFWVDPIANLKMFWMPAILLGLSSSAGLMRFTRTAMLEAIRQDYVRTARAKGLKESVTILRHVMRNAALPVLTIIGIYLAYVVGGSIIFEQIFSLPGIGRYFFTAVAKRDYTSIQAVGLIYAFFVVFINFATDLSYAVFDPRIRYGN